MPDRKYRDLPGLSAARLKVLAKSSVSIAKSSVSIANSLKTITGALIDLSEGESTNPTSRKLHKCCKQRTYGDADHS